eukprot:TRINITY_DN59711_c0_g1_i2.p1 TRINITY_DN59711_c0_g1~~TRINITY_DN59711_c0_g1_i2.p1  ORF type:complete len:452 (-),score=95.02 TRINITY_DN59711_c0_g1_i2:269-1624(-)
MANHEMDKLKAENSRLRADLVAQRASSDAHIRELELVISSRDSEKADLMREWERKILQLHNRDVGMKWVVDTAAQQCEANRAQIRALKAEIESHEADRLSIMDEWDQQLARMDKGEPLRPMASVSRVRKMPKSGALGISDASPQAVWTSERDPSKDREVYKWDGSRDKKPEYDEWKTVRKRLVAPMAGFLSAGLEISLVWPTEYAKTQLQLNRTNKDFKILKHLRAQGLSIYRGLTPMLIGAPFQGLLRFGSLDLMNNMFRDPETGKVGRFSGLLAGISAGCLESVLVVTPMETVKTRLIDSGKGLREALPYIYRTEGLTGFYKGLFPTMAKSCSNQALRFLIFNEYKRIIIGNRPEFELSVLEALVGGMTAGCLGALGNTPFDTVKTRMQGLDAGRYRNMWDCARTMMKHEGILSLWKGVGARLMRVVPGQGIIFCSYESIFNFIYQRYV